MKPFFCIFARLTVLSDGQISHFYPDFYPLLVHRDHYIIQLSISKHSRLIKYQNQETMANTYFRFHHHFLETSGINKTEWRKELSLTILYISVKNMD